MQPQKVSPDRPAIKVDFIDFWPNFLKRDNYFYHILSQRYEVEIGEKDPDIVFMSCYSMDKQRYANHSCKKIFFTGENRGLKCVRGGKWADCPFDYDVTLTFDETGGINTYLPLFVLFINWLNVPHNNERDISYLASLSDLLEPLQDETGLLKKKTKGCCFLAKNPTAEERNQFCVEAQRRFPVDCAGPVLNNCPEIGGRGDQIQKINFISQYRSIIAFENSRHPGYLTEKALHGLATKCVPVYWGADTISVYFNEQNFIKVDRYDQWPSAMQRMQQIIESDCEYLKMVCEPAMKRTVLDEFDTQRILDIID